MRTPFRLIFLLAILVGAIAATRGVVGPVVGRLPDGSVMTPSGQRLEPMGVRYAFGGHPDAIAASPSGNTVIAVNGGALEVIDVRQHAIHERLMPSPFRGEAVRTGRTGIAFDSSGASVWVTVRGDRLDHAALVHYDVQKDVFGTPVIIPERGDAFPARPLLAGIASAHDKLFVAASGENSVAEIDTQKHEFVAAVTTGVAPMEVAAVENLVAVANEGGHLPHRGEATRTSGETAEEVAIDADSGIPLGGSVTLIDTNGLKPLKEIAVGQHPVGLLFTDPNTLLVTNAGDDSLQFLDVPSGRVARQIRISIDADGPLGLQPQQMALSPDRKALFVALAGVNAVAVYDLLDARNVKLRGLLPTDWFPCGLAPLPDGGLAVANLKGIGSLSRSGKKHLSHDLEGSVTLFSRSDVDRASVNTTANVIRLAGAAGRSDRRAHRPPIRHVVFVIRENTPYDMVLGDDASGNGDPSLTVYPSPITPNAHALANEFVLFDNSYAVGVQSADGHQWVTQAIDSEYVEHMFLDFSRSYPFQGTDPLAYSSAGFLWSDAAKHGKSVRVYGEFARTAISPKNATWADFWNEHMAHHGNVTSLTRSSIPSLDKILDRDYPGFELTIPDQLRADEFEKELAAANRIGALPDLLILTLSSDHGAGTAPKFPTPRAMAADNDYALGRVVESLGKSRFWSDTAVFIIEDDTQNGFDHVEGHREVTLVAGPWFRRAVVDSRFYSQLSVIATIEWLLGIPPMNRNDAEAPIMADLFATKPDFRRFRARLPSVALDEMNPPVAGLSPEDRRLANASAAFPKDRPDAAAAELLRAIASRKRR